METDKLKLELQKLQGVIKSLEKDILGLKREIQERDKNIMEKVGLRPTQTIPEKREPSGK